MRAPRIYPDNPHVRICGGLGSATTLVYPTLARGDTARAETLDRDPELHLGRSAWMALRTGEANERTRRNDQIADGNRDREQERAALHEERRTIQERLVELVQLAAEQVKELVRGKDRGPLPQPDHDFGPSR